MRRLTEPVIVLSGRCGAPGSSIISIVLAFICLMKISSVSTLFLAIEVILYLKTIFVNFTMWTGSCILGPTFDRVAISWNDHG